MKQVTDKVREVLADKGREVWWIGPGDSVYRAIELMSERQVGALPVLEGEALVGIISERDYARKVILKGRSSRETPVRDIMTSPVLYASLEHTVNDCMKIMTDRHIRHLPVVDGGHLMGVLSIRDLLRWVLAAQSETIRQLEAYITGTYPA